MRYCPACRAEYAPGTDRCHECEFELVDSLDQAPVEEERRPQGPLVTVDAFDSPLNANILASRLEAEGIPCFIADDETIAAHNLLSGPVGGIKVQVGEADAARATAISREVAASRSGKPPCPRCRSRDVQRKGLSVLLAALVVVTFGVLALFMPVRWHCAACSHRWI